MPPDVPATVRAKVPDVIIGDPLTLISPPVNVCATLLTVPPPLAIVVQVGAPAPFEVKTCPVVPAAVKAYAVPVPYGTAPDVGEDVPFVPPDAIGNVPVVSAEVDVA